MALNVPLPDLSALLPPLLACLPAALASPQPPSALYQLLSPILQQRVKILSESTGSDSDSSWLHLLCWDPDEASRLASAVQSADLEPHPVSGEVEFGDIVGPRYRRLDEETLQSLVILPELNISVIFLWCQGDERVSQGAWRVAEVRTSTGGTVSALQPWKASVREADEASKTALLDGLRSPRIELSTATPKDESKARVDDANDDDYWSRYDQAPSDTPAAPGHPASSSPAPHPHSVSEADYYASYSQIQPALDNHDPSEDHDKIGESTLDGNTLTGHFLTPPASTANGGRQSVRSGSIESSGVVHIRPTSSAASSRSIVQLELSAEHQSRAEVAIQHHVSTSIKSLYRLARGAGIETSEFQRLVRVEIETLGFMNEDD